MACTKEGVGLAIRPQSGHSSLHSSGSSTGVPPRGYPRPVVDLARGREQALAALAAIRKG